MSKESARIRRSKKLRAKLQKEELMRVSISRSLKNITAQLIDSSSGKVLATVSTQQKALKSTNGGNIEAASKVGGEIAKKAIELDTGARGLRSIIEKMLMETMFELPSQSNIDEVVINEDVIIKDKKPITVHSKNKKSISQTIS